MYRSLLIALIPLIAPRVSAQGTDTVEVRDLRAVPQDVEDGVRSVLRAGTTRQVRGTLEIGPHDTVTTDVAILEGELVVEGVITGQVVAINASLTVRGRGRVTGPVVVIGGVLNTLDVGGVDGDARVYPEPVRIDRASGRIVVRDESQDESWYRRLFTHAPSSGSDLRLVTTRTYNRVEGLPILLGPRLRLAFSWGLVTVDAMGILRSADRFELRSENLGHQLRAEVEAGGPYRLRLGVRNEDLVQSPESWHLSDSEVGIASFILHRDYRDYYNSHGKAVTLGASMRDHLDASVEYADEHWGPLTARDPWSLLRDNQHWRPNPQMDDGHFHLIRAGLTFDNRNDRRDPWSGWYVSGEYEYGSGWITSYAPSTAGVRDVNPTGRTVYDRAFIDVRRYNRLSAEGQLNLRLVAGGWLSGDELPLERRFSLGSTGSLPGYDFRQVLPGVDRLSCAGTRDGDAMGPPRSPDGTPAQCERILLGQVEYRGEIGSRLFGFLSEERRRRRFGWGRRAEWVVFADAGRGWLVGHRVGELQYGAGTLPPLSTFRADVGIGIRLDDLGLYVAKSVTDPGTPVNFFARLRPRF